MSDGPNPEAIASWAARVDAWPTGTATEVTLLDGGFSWQTFHVESEAGSVIVRVAPRGGTVEPYDPQAEADALAEATGAGIPVPGVIAVDDGGVLGRPAAVHTFIPGVSIRPGDPVPDRSPYRTSLATTLASIHTEMPAASITIESAYARALEDEMNHYRRVAPCAHPVFELAWRWLVTNVPDDDRPAVRLHGDYRLANLLWAAPGELSGVLDWERSWSGDPMCDVAFSRLFSGWCAIDGDAADAYSEASGIDVDEERVWYATVFERWRSFTSAMRGLAAFVDGRNPDRRLIRIGLAGEAGAWRLSEAFGVSAGWDRSGWPDGVYRSLLLEREAPAWPELREADVSARTHALEALSHVSVPDRPTGPEGSEQLYSDYHALATRLLAEGREIPELLRALALRATLRFELLEEQGWH